MTLDGKVRSTSENKVRNVSEGKVRNTLKSKARDTSENNARNSMEGEVRNTPESMAHNTIQKKHRAIYAVVAAAGVIGLLTVGIIIYRHMTAAQERKHVVIAVPYSDKVQDYETNYYTRWLEEKTGMDISFVYLEEGYERESLRAMLTSPNSIIDGIFLPPEQDFITYEEYREYISAGLLCAPCDYLDKDSRLYGVMTEYPEVEFSGLLGEDGCFYCFPSLRVSQTSQNMQVLWINIDWLSDLNLTVPKTTKELKEALIGFAGRDPNGNGKYDEIPLISCEAENSFKSYRYLINAFVYYDGMRLPGYGTDREAEELRAFRKGIEYCRELYVQGLLNGDTFGYTKKQIMELVNAPEDLVGAFASHSIADVVYTNNPGILAHFVQIAPLSSDYLERGYAVRTEIVPDIGGIIPARAAGGREAAQIMDMMLQEEAALIALYGEEGVDWRFSKDGELSTYGTRANVTTIHYLKGERQNKNYASAGPLVAPAEYLDGVTWNGDHSMTEYIDARAVKAYEPYYIGAQNEKQEKTLQSDLSKSEPNYIRQQYAARYLESMVTRYITGERNIKNDMDWERFVAEYGKLVE